MNMKKKLNQGLWPILILTVICMISTALLALTSEVTRDARAAQEEAAQMASKQKLFPEAEKFEAREDLLRPEDADKILSLEKVMNKDGSESGWLLLSQSRGYGGQVPVYVALDADGAVSGLDLPANDETPGLGQRVHEEAFYSQFVNDEPDVRFYAKTEGKDTDVTWTKIDAVSAATISSNAVCTAVNQARSFYAAVLAIEQK